MSTRQVTTAALVKRINRRLAKDNEMLKVTRGDRWRNDLGDFYIVSGNRLVAQHVDPEELGREVGALADSESLAGDGDAGC